MTHPKDHLAKFSILGLSHRNLESIDLLCFRAKHPHKFEFLLQAYPHKYSGNTDLNGFLNYQVFLLNYHFPKESLID